MPEITEFSPDVILLMPTMSKTFWDETFGIRYGGLTHELEEQGLSVGQVLGHASYNSAEGVFTEGSKVTSIGSEHSEHIAQLAPIGRMALGSVVRDLTMTKSDKPLHRDLQWGLPGTALVHHPDFNGIIRDKSKVFYRIPELHPRTIVAEADEVLEAIAEIPGHKVIVKPTVGSAGDGVHIGTKREVTERVKALALALGEPQLVQEFIDTSAGNPDLGVNGVHTQRTISVGNKAIFSVARDAVRGLDHNTSDDVYASFHEPDRLPQALLDLLSSTHTMLASLPDGKDTAVSIDTMRGVGADGEMREYLGEINRRPLRISRYHISHMTTPIYDRRGLLRSASNWDKSEAEMLARVAASVRH